MPVTLKGFCGLQLYNEIAKVNVKIGGEQGVNVPVTAYLVDNLEAGLIIGLNQLEALDAVLHLKRRVIAIGEKEVKLTFTGEADSKSIPLNAHWSLEATVHCA